MTEHEKLIAVPPDGGWGWVIVCGAFYSNILVDAPTIGFQVLQPHLMELLAKTGPQVSVIFSAYAMTMFIAGPFAGGVCNRFGFRTTTIIGCIFMLVGMTVSFFTDSFGGFFIFFGLVSGTGTSFIVMVSSVATGFWFESKRALAMGISNSASGFSVFTVYLADYVSKTYGWRWCFITWAGMTIILCGCSFLLAMPPMFELETDISYLSMLDGEKEELDISKIISIRLLDYEISGVQRMSERKVRKMMNMTGIGVMDIGGRPSIVSDAGAVGVGKWCPFCLCCDWCQQSVGSRPLYRRDVFYEGNLDHAAKVENKNKDTFALSMVMLPTTKDVKQEVECPMRVPEAVTRAISNMIDFSLFESPIFLLIMVASIFIYTVRYIPFLLIKRLNVEHMDESSATCVMSMMGFGSLLCRGAIGFFLYNFKNISALSTSVFTTIVGGMVLCCIPLNYWYPYQLCMSFIGGGLPAMIGTLRSIVIIDFIGLDKLTSCTGALLFIQGLASFAGLPLGELLNSRFDTFYAGIVFSGACYVVAGLLFSIVGLLSHERISLRGSSILWDTLVNLLKEIDVEVVPMKGII